MFWAWGLVVCTAWVLGTHYLGDTDQGYLQGLAWRVFQGEEIYTGVDYVRPPLSPWFHSVWFELFGVGGGLLAGRMFMVIQIAIAGWCQLDLLRENHQGRASVWLFLTVFFLGLHNFPAMPWHTIDGIFWGSVGLWLLRQESNVLFSGWLLIGAAVLTKQSFYLLPILVIVGTLLEPGRSSKKIILSLLVLCLLAIPTVWLRAGFWKEMLSWTTGASSFEDLWKVGIMGYLLPLLPAALVVAVREWLRRSGKERLARWCYPAMVAGLASIWLLMMILANKSTPPPFRMAHILWWVAVWEAGKLVLARRAQGYPWLVLLGLGWCASLSWGYPTPILVAGPLLWILHSTDSDSPQQILPLLPLCLITVIGFFYPYREQHDFPTNSDSLIAAYPSLEYIQPGSEITQELLELDSLRRIFPGSFTVLPNWPQIHVLTETNNPLRIDWAHNAEGRFDADPELYLPGLENCEVVFVDKDNLDKAEQKGKYGSILLNKVLETWEPMAEGGQFIVFQKRPKKQ